MKKSPKRLTLHRETLGRLADGQLAGANGAATVKPQVCCGMSDSCPPPPSLDAC
jgi:hypothetical protein